MNRQQLFFLFFVGLLLFIVAQVLLILSPFVQPIFWAAIVAFAFYPVHKRLRRALRGSSNAAALLTTALVFLLFVPLVAFIVGSLAAESANLYHWVQESVREGRHEELVERLTSLPVVRRVRELAASVEIVRENYRGWTASAMETAGNFVAKQAGQLTRSVILGPLHLFLTFFLVFFFLRDGARIQEFLYDITPMEEENKRNVFAQVTGTFEAVIRGQLLTAIVQALLALVIFLGLGVPLPVLFASLTFVASLVPILGSPMVWFPLVVWLIVQEAYARAAALFLLGAFGISLVDNFLKPILIGEKTKLPYLVLFLGILGGLQVYGLMGMFLAPTVLSLFFVLIKMYREKFFTASDAPRL